MKEPFNLSETYRRHFNQRLDQGYDFTLRSYRKNDLLEFCEVHNLDPDVARFTISKVRKQELKRRGLDVRKFGFDVRIQHNIGDMRSHITEEYQ